MKKQNSIKIITYACMLAACAVILEKLSVNLSLGSSNYNIKLTLYGLPLLLAGMVYGIKTGFLTGLVTGFITQIILSQYGIGPTTPIWMLAPMIWGTLSALFIKLFKNKFSWYSIIITILATAVIVSLFNSLALYLDALILHYPHNLTIVLIFIRLGLSIVSSVIYIPLVYILIKRIHFTALE